ncbi:MAG: hypothetical protein K2M13_10250 [Muribaculaceae bacterium]|nr:hypothetical protein [Muribaculaceae bacterium]
MKRGYDFEKPVPITGIGFSWLPYNNEDLLSDGFFTIDEWHKIIYDIDNMVQWQEFLERYRRVCTCYVLYSTHSIEPIAICYLLAEDGLYENYCNGEVISVHGGGWKNDFRSRYLYARAWMRIVHYLDGLGCKVLTNVKADNFAATRLVTGSGFSINELGLFEYHSDKDMFKNEIV